MIIKNLKIQNFRSFGNNINELDFDGEKGNLVLLMGDNGFGKTSIQLALDFALYGEVKNNNKKVKLSSLPNRMNKYLMVELEFLYKNQNIKTIRRINPNDFKVFVDNEELVITGKEVLQDKLLEYNDFDINSWKSFISMSINDFKNFTTLKPEEKRMLLDKLFNLEMINTIASLIKEKKKQFKHESELYNREINSYNNSLNELRKNIDKIKIITKNNFEKEKEDLKKELLSKKDNYLILQERLNKCSEKNIELNKDVKRIQISITETDFRIKNLNDKINLYNLGKCPTCNNNLSSNIYDSYREELVENLNTLVDLKNQLSLEYTEYNTKQKKLSSITIDANNLFNELKYHLKSLKEKLNNIEEKTTEDILEVNTINQLVESIENIENDKKNSEINYNKSIEDENIHDEILQLFSEDGIKKSIISKIIQPINKFITDNINLLKMNFIVNIDDEFNAKIEYHGDEIDTQELSTGETRKINLCIMLAYLKLIRTKKHINILFLDEVFSSISVEGINDVIKILKEFAYEYKINVFIIHHAMLDKNLFDKVIRLEKGITSNIILEE